VQSAWKQIDQTYVPKTGITFAAFSTLRATCQTKFENVSKEGAEEGQAGGELSKALKELYRLSVDWYQEAIRRFGPETPHGMLIREQIDTGSATPPPSLPGKAVISSLTFESSNMTAEYDAPGATHFDVWLRIAPEVDFTKVRDKTADKSYTHTDTHGDFEVKVAGWNESGYGPESDVGTISG